jgi:ribonuclease T2
MFPIEGKFPGSRRPLALALIVAVGLLNCVSAAKTHRNAADKTADSFNYYLLTLSWAPEFCAAHARYASSTECDPAHHFGFVVHGLWPENENGSYPQHCSSAQPVVQEIVRQMLPIMPDRGLIQHEWATHGTCSGLDAETYFGDIEKAFSQLRVPAEYRSSTQPISATPSQIEQKFAAANNTSTSAFRVSCTGPNFVAIEVCLTKDLQYRNCGEGVRECRAPHVSLLPSQ